MSHSPNSRPDVALVHVASLPSSLFDDFRDAVSDDDLTLVIESRDDTPYAGLEWLLPTAVVVFITHSYFDGIFKEMGKDHYSLLKSGLKSLWKKLLGPSRPKFVVVSSPGKAMANQPYSLVYSIMADAAPGLKVQAALPHRHCRARIRGNALCLLGVPERFPRQDARFENDRASK